MAQLSEVTVNNLEISEATMEQSPLHPPSHASENPNEEGIEDHLRRSIQRRLDELQNEDEVPNSFLITRIPCYMREKNKMYLDPLLMSIGPYHRGMENLQAFEMIKIRFLRDFLARSPSLSVEDLIETMKSLESRARQCYSENFELDSDQFVEMLLLDTCFIAEFMRKIEDGGASSVKIGYLNNILAVFSDMLLIENQTPFFVLESILDISLVTSFFRQYWFLCLYQTQAKTPSQIAHLVHLCYQLYIPPKITPSNDNSTLTIKLKELFLSVKHRIISQNRTKEPVHVIPSASELCEAGITFKKKQSPLGLLDITFDKGVLEMAPIVVDDTQKRILLNLLAFEQYKFEEVDDHLFLSSYFYLMQYIVRTSKDMAILRKCGIISDFEPNEEESVSFFNHVADLIYMEIEMNIFHQLFSDINDYYEGSWHQYRAKLKRDYFNSPWSIISLGGGLTLLVLTFLQTIYGIKSYKSS